MYIIHVGIELESKGIKCEKFMDRESRQGILLILYSMLCVYCFKC